MLDVEPLKNPSTFIRHSLCFDGPDVHRLHEPQVLVTRIGYSRSSFRGNDWGVWHGLMAVREGENIDLLAAKVPLV